MVITEDWISNWVGNFGYAELREKYMLTLIGELVNGKQKIEDIAYEIEAYNE